jgi:hypothetical protein
MASPSGNWPLILHCRYTLVPYRPLIFGSTLPTHQSVQQTAREVPPWRKFVHGGSLRPTRYQHTIWRQPTSIPATAGGMLPPAQLYTDLAVEAGGHNHSPVASLPC